MRQTFVVEHHPSKLKFKSLIWLNLLLALLVHNNGCDAAHEESAKPHGSAQRAALAVPTRSTEEYVTCSRQRSAWLAKHWQEHRAAPDASAVTRFFARAGWQEDEYNVYGSQHRAAVEAYLQSHPAIEAEIAQASQTILTVIEGMEVRR